MRKRPVPWIIQPLLKRQCKRWLRRILLSLIAAVLFSSPVRATLPESSPTPSIALVQQGKSLYDTGQFSSSIKALQQAVSAFEATGDKLSQAMTLSNLSLAYQQLGQWTEAQEAIAQSLTLLHELGDTSKEQILAQTLDIQGRLQLGQGHSQAALDTWQQSAELYARLGDEAGTIRSQTNQAQALKVLGLHRQAQKKLTESLPLLQNQPVSLQAIALRSLGNVFRDIGDLKSSQQVLEQSLALLKQLQTSDADTLLSLGNTARAQQNAPAALEFYDQAASAASSDFTRLQARLNQLSLLLETDQLNAASALRSQIEPEIAALPPSREAIYARINLAESLKQLKSRSDNAPTWETIAQHLATSLQQAKDLQDRPAISYALGSLAGVYEQTQQWHEAIDLAEQALSIAQAIGSPDIAYRWQWQLGRLYGQEGSEAMPKAIAAYSQAVTSLQSLRSDLVAINPDAQFSFREEVEPVYRQFVNLLLHASEDSQPSQENLQQARYTIESLQIAELENFFRSACLDSRVEIDRVVDQEYASAAVIYPIALEQRLEIIVKLPGQEALRHYTTAVTQEQIQSTVTQLRRYLRDVTQTSQVKQLSQQLYDWLIRPLEAELTSNRLETLVFVLDSPLRNIPMGVLYDQGQQKYLVQKYAIAVAPSLQLVDPKPLQNVEMNALMAGVSEKRSFEGREFAPLANVKRELERIQTEVTKSEELFNREFTETNLQSQLESAPFSVVHLATHGQFSSNPEETYILTWNNLLKVEDFDRLLRQSRANGPSAIELLVLSACKTAQGDKRAALGLAGVAVRAGARSTLATLWSVDDLAATELMSQFYQEIGTGVTKAQALQNAQLAVLDHEKRPYFWAPFVLVGNWL